MMLIKGNEVTIIVIIQQNWVDLKFAPNKNNNNNVVDMDLFCRFIFQKEFCTIFQGNPSNS